MDLFYEKFGGALKNIGVIPVVAIADETELETLMDAISGTPLKCIEITLRNDFAPKAIKAVKENYPDIIVGAGTVTNEERLDTAIKNGADFCVSPWLDAALIKKAKERGMLFLPGVATPTEAFMAGELGITTVKFFPAEAMGGTDVLKLYAGALADNVFIPTGGITMDNFEKYISQKNVLACGGSFMAPKSALTSGDSKTVRENILKCISICEKAGK